MCSNNCVSYSSNDSQRPITIDLIRKRSEHNSNLISSLEEIALHQEELTSIGTTIGKACGKTLRILLLQNNVIGNLHKFEMKYFKVLEYLNLALNNLTAVRGLDGSVNEHLSKIDLTLNFIDFDTLKESMDCLASLRNLKELFMMGNPCCLDTTINNTNSNSNGNDKERKEEVGEPPMIELLDEEENGDVQGENVKKQGWRNFRMYVISQLSTLESLDGKIILRSERIKAMQMKPELEIELKELAKHCRIWKVEEQKLNALEKNCSQDTILQDVGENDNESDHGEATKHCPQDRMKLSNEMAMQKAEKETRERANQPKLKSEKDFEEDQRQTIEKARLREEKGDIKQCNGKYLLLHGQKRTICIEYRNQRLSLFPVIP